MTGESGAIDANDAWLVEAFPYEGEGSGTGPTPIYLGTKSITIEADDPDAPNREYDGRLSVGFTLKREMHRDGKIGGNSLPSYGDLEIRVDTHLVDNGTYAAWRDLVWSGHPIRILHGEGTTHGEYDVMFEGVMGPGVSFGKTTIRVPIADLQELLTKPVHTLTYAGSGGTEGTAEKKGVHKPWSCGVCRGVEPPPSDGPNLWFDMDPVNGVHSVLLVTDGSGVLTADVSNPPASGKYYLDAASGRIRLQTSPTYGLRVDFRSKFGSNALTAGDICEALLTGPGGLSAGDIDSASFAAFDTATSATSGSVGRWYADPPSIDEILDLLVGSVGGFYTTSREGKFSVGVLTAPTATVQTDPSLALVVTDATILRDGLSIEPVGDPPSRIEVGCRHCHAPILEEDRINPSGTAAAKDFLRREYRVEIEAGASTTSWPLAKPLRTDTAIDEPDVGADLAHQLGGLYCVARSFVTVRLALAPMQLELGHQIWIESDLYDIDAAWRVIEVDDSDAPRVVIRAWR